MTIQQDKHNLSQSNLGIVSEFISKGQYKEALTELDKLTQSHPNDGTLYFLGGNCYGAMGHFDQAILCYQEAIKLKPNYAEAHNNLGFYFKEVNKIDKALLSYREAIKLKPNYAEAHNNSGNVLKDLGQFDEAISSYKLALELKPDYLFIFNNIGAIMIELGRIDEAREFYGKARGGNKDFEQGFLLLNNKKFTEAIKFFEKSRFLDWKEKVLECQYKNRDFNEFKENLLGVIKDKKHDVIELASMTAHYAQNFKKEDPYNFCPSPLDFTCHEQVPELMENDQQLIKDLISDINTADIGQRKQSRLTSGIQSSGNLFKRKEPTFKKLHDALVNTINRYFLRYQDENNEFIRSFPKDVSFSSAWFVKMQSGGHLSSHIHEEGWVSGAVYLAIPKDSGPGGQEGAIELSSDGDEYPRLHDEFEKKVILPNVGDVIFFPSSVFHRTIPFNSNEERICIAFDVKPKLR